MKQKFNRKPIKKKPLKKKKCRACKKEFQPRNSLQVVCYNPKCALDYVRIVNDRKQKQIEKRERQEHTKKKQEVKPLKHWIDYTQRVFNNWIVLRDKDEPCISCRKHVSWLFCAGHYKTTAARSDIRFNEDNVHKQCSRCNTHLSGNIIEYRPHLVEKIGQERVDALDVQNLVTYTVEQLKEIRVKYNKRIRHLNNGT